MAQSLSKGPGTKDAACGRGVPSAKPWRVSQPSAHILNLGHACDQGEHLRAGGQDKLGRGQELTGQKGTEAGLPRQSHQLSGPASARCRAATHHLVQALRSMPVWACAQRMAVRTSTCGSALGSRPSREGDHSPPTSTASSSFRPSKNCRK